MLGNAAPTPYDLNFRLLRVPVRVHPLFWLVTALLGWRDGDLHAMSVWVGCVFISVLVHEFGHGLMARAFGCEASVVLFAMGGYCDCQMDRQSRGQRLAVLFAGPGAGFLLFGLILGILFLMGGVPSHPTANLAIQDLLFINLFWGLLNLLPIWPLDGGRITQEILSWFSRRNGVRWSHVVSLLAAGILAVVVFRPGDLFMSIWFGYFALINFQVLQAMHERARYGLFDDDPWRS